MPKFDRDALAKAVASQTLWTMLTDIVTQACQQEWSSSQLETSYAMMCHEINSARDLVYLYDMIPALEDMKQLKFRALEREKQYVVAVEEVFHV